MSWMNKFWSDESGMDSPIMDSPMQFTLLVAFVVLASSPLFIKSGGTVAGIWISRDAGISAYLESGSGADSKFLP